MDLTETKIEKMKAQIELLNLEISRLKSRLNMPTSPGWYWALVQGEPKPVAIRVMESTGSDLKELYCWGDYARGPVTKADSVIQWLGPVTPWPDTLKDKYKIAMKAVWHLYRRIQRDPNVNWYCGNMTETLRLTCEAIAAETGEDPEDVVQHAIRVQLDEPQVERLRKRVEELEAKG